MSPDDPNKVEPQTAPPPPQERPVTPETLPQNDWDFEPVKRTYVPNKPFGPKE